MHVSGERLSQLTGIAAKLRYPMADLDLAEDHHHHENNHEPAEANLMANPNRPSTQTNQNDDDDELEDD